MLNGIAYRRAEGKQEDLCNREESRPKDDITDRPSIFQRTEHQYQLRDDVDDCANQGPDDVDDPKSKRLGILESRKALERRDGDEKRDPEDSKATES